MLDDVVYKLIKYQSVLLHVALSDEFLVLNRGSEDLRYGRGLIVLFINELVICDTLFGEVHDSGTRAT